MPLLLLVTADDLGIDARRDDGIFETVAAGSVTQASLLVAGPSAAEAAARARRDGLPLGLHLNLTEGVPVAGLRRVPSLCDAAGAMLGKHGFRAALDAGIVRLEDVAVETAAQLERFAALTGSPAAHVDGHQHVHVVPALAALLAAVFARAGVRTTRVPAEPTAAAAGSFYAQVSADADPARIVFARHGIRATQAFAGLDLMGASATADGLARAVRDHAGARSLEIMCHPGRPGTGWDAFNRSPDRDHERAVLCARPFASLVAGGVARLGSFADLAALENP